MSEAEAASALRWWLESGVDTVVREQPRDWLEPAAAPARTSEKAAEPQAPKAAPAPDLDSFRAWITSASDAPLAAKGSKPIHPQGAESSEVMLIAEPPGREDAAAGRPIGGEAWELTRRMLTAIGIQSEAAYFANLACFYSPGARLSPEQLDQCAEAARRHIALARPRRLLLLGESPARALLGKSLTDARGHVHAIEGVRTVSTFHPRFLFDRPAEKARAWADLLLLMEES